MAVGLRGLDKDVVAQRAGRVLVAGVRLGVVNALGAVPAMVLPAS
nr:hypothetical protein [Microbispora cellulosiformans]